MTGPCWPEPEGPEPEGPEPDEPEPEGPEPAGPGAGTEPPTSPVLPPWAMTGAPCAAQARTTAAVSAVLAGRTTQAAGPA